MKIEKFTPQTLIRAWRLWLLGALFLAGFSTLIWRLWNVQVLDSPQYGAAQSAQSFRYVEIPGLRGRILDRNDEVLAENRPAYAVALYCEELQSAGRYTTLGVDNLFSIKIEFAIDFYSIKWYNIIVHLQELGFELDLLV